MAKRDYESSPVSHELGLKDVILGLADDLKDLRGKRISPAEGLARAAVAKQLFNGVRLYLQAYQMLSAQAGKAEPMQSIEAAKDTP